jgi:hypothetical protein
MKMKRILTSWVSIRIKIYKKRRVKLGKFWPYYVGYESMSDDEVFERGYL